MSIHAGVGWGGETVRKLVGFIKSLAAQFGKVELRFPHPSRVASLLLVA